MDNPLFNIRKWIPWTDLTRSHELLYNYKLDSDVRYGDARSRISVGGEAIDSSYLS